MFHNLFKGIAHSTCYEAHPLKDLKDQKDPLNFAIDSEGRVVGLCWEKLKPKGPKKDIY